MKINEKIDIAVKYMQKISISQGRDWVTPTEVGGEINGGHSSVGSPVCKEMVNRGLAIRNEKGHYCLIFGDKMNTTDCSSRLGCVECHEKGGGVKSGCYNPPKATQTPHPLVPLKE